ncbi:hypothetical protein BU15DRAFT_64257 [Melanogaster broomeanus]|nr:hypothetical protein BU15DRAFT_64257 [Melanogaster broomeanus]
MAHWQLPQFAQSDNMNDNVDYHWQPILSDFDWDQRLENHQQVVIYNSFQQQAMTQATINSELPVQFYYQPDEPVHVPQPQPHVMNQTAACSLVPQPHEHFFNAGPFNQPLPHFPPLQQQQQESEYPPVYLTANNVPVTQTAASTLLVVPPAYNYVANHPSSANNQFINSLLQKGAHQLAYTIMDALSDMWIYSCNNVIGKDGPMDILMKRIINNAGF